MKDAKESDEACDGKDKAFTCLRYEGIGVTCGGGKKGKYPPPHQYFFNLRIFLVTELNNGK
jgi:hypothetical protein